MSENNTISKIKVDEIVYSINDPTKIDVEVVNELIDITSENKDSLNDVNNKLDQLLAKVNNSGIDTSDATATSNDILSGFTAYVNGVKVIGTLDLSQLLPKNIVSGIVINGVEGIHVCENNDNPGVIDPDPDPDPNPVPNPTPNPGPDDDPDILYMRTVYLDVNGNRVSLNPEQTGNSEAPYRYYTEPLVWSGTEEDGGSPGSSYRIFIEPVQLQSGGTYPTEAGITNGYNGFESGTEVHDWYWQLRYVVDGDGWVDGEYRDTVQNKIGQPYWTGTYCSKNLYGTYNYVAEIWEEWYNEEGEWYPMGSYNPGDTNIQSSQTTLFN